MGVKSPERTASAILKKFTFVRSVVGCDDWKASRRVRASAQCAALIAPYGLKVAV
jgi:hypothetical protein